MLGLLIRKSLDFAEHDASVSIAPGAFASRGGVHT
jgi:hypothetical protein